jgi:hypothetical protein
LISSARYAARLRTLEDGNREWCMSRSPSEGRSLAGIRLPGGLGWRPRPTLRARWLNFWRAENLDRALAAGADPLTSDALLLRANQLAESRSRLAFADSAMRIVDEAVGDGPPTLPGPQLLQRRSVAAHSPLLMDLVERLRDNAPHGLRGLAKTHLLLCGGDSPLYMGQSPRRLKIELVRILAALDPT